MVKFSRTRGLAVCVAAAGALATALYVGHWDKGSQSTKGIKQGLPHSADTDLLYENVAVGKAYTILDDKHSDHVLIFQKEGVNDLEENDKERYEEVIKQKEELQKDQEQK